MPKRVHKPFPKGDACPICGSKVRILWNTSTYKTCICPKCGYWDYWIKEEHS